MVSTNISQEFSRFTFFLNFIYPLTDTLWDVVYARACVCMCTCLLCVCTNDIDVRVCVIVRNRNSVRGRALRSKGGSNEIDTSALDSPLLSPFLSYFFSLPFITFPPSLRVSYFLHSPSNDYEPREDPC